MPSPNISFQYSCSQKWGSMPVTGAGKFCAQCKTSVHNLEERSHEEIAELLRANNNHLCGYFYDDQLSPPAEQKNFFHPKLILASLAAWLTFNAPKVSAQVTFPTEQHDSSAVPKKDVHRYGIVNKNNVCFVDEDPVTVTPKKKRRHTITLFRIGGRRVFLSKRFPFIHSRRMRVGMMAF